MQFIKTRDQCTIPQRGTPLSAGFDLASAEDITLLPNKVTCIPVGIAVKLPEGYYGRVALRSGWSTRNNAVCTAGVIDRDYMGELMVAVIVFGEQIVEVKKGDRIAQLVVERYYTGGVSDNHEAFHDHPGTHHGHHGWGSTGN